MKFLIVLKAIVLLGFLGWLLMWMLSPTKSYTYKWYAKREAKLSSTYFEDEGSNLLLFVFPMMLVAVLGCIYLQLQQKSGGAISNSSTASSKFGLWERLTRNRKQPVLIMAPLGIITATELAFAAMFIVLFVWSIANYLHARLNFDMAFFVGIEVWELKIAVVASALAYLGNVCLAFLFFPVTRGSSILPLVGLTSEASIKYHIWLGNLSVFLFTVHSIGYIVYFLITNQASKLVDWNRHWVSNVAGEVAAICGAIMLVTSLNPIRRKKFEVFFYMHHLYILFIFFFVLHIGFAYFCMVLPGVFLFLVDRYLRFLQSRQRAQLVSARILPCDVIELNFSKTRELKYNPTSILFVNVPAISKMEWHPFTVTSNCNLEPESVSIVIKNLGNWSQKLLKELSSADALHVSVEGTYGPSSSNFLRHQLLVMVGGGSGITPLISILREAMFESTKPNCKLPKILLICAFKNSADLSWLDLLLPQSNAQLSLVDIHLQIEAYITREPEQKIPNVNTQKPTKTIFFKSDPTSRPISPVLGPKSWFCLSAIIAASFITYLLLLGIVTRFYIYPLDGKTETDYHVSLKALWNMSLVCLSIVLAASSVFLWSKRQAALEAEQVSDLGPQLSGDRELESPPDMSIVQATKVHFGGRPDLQKILFECKESDVGVLVSGPRDMRHEVAKICASNSVGNLHFESISFNW